MRLPSVIERMTGSAHPAGRVCSLRGLGRQGDPGVFVIVTVGGENHGTQDSSLCGGILEVVVVVVLAEIQALLQLRTSKHTPTGEEHAQECSGTKTGGEDATLDEAVIMFRLMDHASAE